MFNTFELRAGIREIFIEAQHTIAERSRLIWAKRIERYKEQKYDAARERYWRDKVIYNYKPPEIPKAQPINPYCFGCSRISRGMYCYHCRRK